MSLYINDILVSNFQQIAECFNDYFIEIGPKLSHMIPSTTFTAIDYVAKLFPHSPGRFKFSPVSSLDISKLLAEMPRDKATGLDNIQARLLKIASPAISDSLAFIFNKSLVLGSFPDAWKTARISAIHKKGPKTNPGNYRPISILPVISKLLERLVHNQVYEYLSKHQILVPHQSGFRPKHSTKTSLHS